MRGIAGVLVTIFISALLFGILAPAVLEPIGEFVVNYPGIAGSKIDAAGLFDGLKNVILLWAPIITIGGSIIFAVRYYLNRERFVARGRR